MFQQIHEQLQLDESFPLAFFQTSERQQFLHYHDCLELNIVERGRGSYLINGRRYPMQPGDIFVINNEELHMAIHTEGEEPGLDLSVLVFDVQLLWRNKGISQFLTPFLSRKDAFSHRIAAGSSYSEELLETFQRIRAEYEQQAKGWQTAVEALLMYLLTLLYRCYDEKQEIEEEQEHFQRMYTRIRSVFTYINEHFQEEIVLDQLAQFVSLSPHYLCRCFKKVTGRTIFAYIEQMRIQYSCYLLRTTRNSVMEIALESGFHTVSYYNRIFKKCMGQTPKEYRMKKEFATESLPPAAFLHT